MATMTDERMRPTVAGAGRYVGARAPADPGRPLRRPVPGPQHEEDT